MPNVFVLECVFAGIRKAVQCGGPVVVVTAVHCSSADCIFSNETNVTQQFVCREDGVTTYIGIPAAVCRQHAITADCARCGSPIAYAQEAPCLIR